MQISRLFGIVHLLTGRKCVTAKELAARFEVSVRTIYRDVEALSAAGIPVYTTQAQTTGSNAGARAEREGKAKAAAFAAALVVCFIQAEG